VSRHKGKKKTPAEFIVRAFFVFVIALD